MLRLEAQDRVLFAGQTGTGKSHAAKALIADELGRRRRVIVVDPKNEWSQDRGGPLPHPSWTAGQLAADPNVVAEADLALAIVPNSPSARDAARAFELVAELVREAGLPVVLVLEEVQYWAHHARELLDAVATMWRDSGVTVIFVTQRAAGVPINARSQVDQIVSFAQQEPADIKALRERTGISDPTFADRVSRLSGRQSLTWRAGLIRPGATHGEVEERRSPVEREPGESGVRGSSDPVGTREDQRSPARREDRLDRLQGRDDPRSDPEGVAAAELEQPASSPPPLPSKQPKAPRRRPRAAARAPGARRT